MRRLQLLLLLLGVALFGFVVHKAGVGRVVDGLRSVGWAFLSIFAIELVIDVLHSEAWRWCLPESVRSISRFHTLLARTGGVAVNALTPTASVGGEVVKGMLLRRWMPLANGFASVMVDKLTFAIAQALFLCFGMVAVLTGLSLNSTERLLAVAALAVWLIAVVAFFVLQRTGIFRLGVGIVRGLFGGSAMIERLPGHAEAFDRLVTHFLAHHHRDLSISVLLHLLAQFARVPQYYLVMSALGLHPSVADCFTTAAGLVFMEATMFLIPAKLGVFEGGNALIFTRLGYTVSDAIVVSFTLRLSELASALLGLMALLYLHFDGAEREETIA